MVASLTFFYSNPSKKRWTNESKTNKKNIDANWLLRTIFKCWKRRSRIKSTQPHIKCKHFDWIYPMDTVHHWKREHIRLHFAFDWMMISQFQDIGMGDQVYFSVRTVSGRFNTFRLINWFLVQWQYCAQTHAQHTPKIKIKHFLPLSYWRYNIETIV